MDATHYDFQECQPRITTPWAVSVKGTILVADLSFFWGEPPRSINQSLFTGYCGEIPAFPSLESPMVVRPNPHSTNQ
jgi:hypothetical protein